MGTRFLSRLEYLKMYVFISFQTWMFETFYGVLTLVFSFQCPTYEYLPKDDFVAFVL